MQPIGRTDNSTCLRYKLGLPYTIAKIKLNIGIFRSRVVFAICLSVDY